MAKVEPFNQKEISFYTNLFSIPENWNVEAAHFIFNEVRDGTHDSPKSVQGGIPLITSKNLKASGIDFVNVTEISILDHEEISKRSSVKKGDILFSMIGTVGNVAIVDNNENFSIKNVGLFRSNPQYLYPKFSFYWLKGEQYQKYLDSLKRGGNQKFVSLGTLRSSPVILPSFAEQKQIAAKLDELLAQVDTLKTRLDTIPTILKRFRQSVLASAVSGQLTEEWRNENKELQAQSLNKIKCLWIDKYTKDGKKYRNSVFVKSKQELEFLPATWTDTQLGFVFDVHVGATPSRKNPDYWKGNISWISSSEVAFCRIKQSKEYITERGLQNSSTSIHPPGTVMLAMIGQGKTRGQPAILDIEACHNQNTAALRVLDSVAVSEYLYYFLYERYEETRRIGSGNNQKAMNKKLVQSLAFPLPPKKEQTEIVRRVEQLFCFADQIEQRIKDAQSKVNNLTQSILAKAFRGELTKEWRKQNYDLISGENSAEALLAQITVERELITPKKQTKRKKTG